MQPLLIEVDGRVLRFDTANDIKIGRSIEADVVLAAGSVSRSHCTLSPGHNGWLLRDNGSALGTFVNGQRISELQIEGPITVQCGPPSGGSTLTITPESQASEDLAQPSMPPAPAPAPVQPGQWQPPAPFTPEAAGAPPMAGAPGAPTGPAAPGGPGGPGGGGDSSGGAFDQTFILAAQPPGPPGSGPMRSGPDLLIVVEGREYRYRHPATVTIGRLPESDIVISDPVASRRHGQVVASPGGWVYQNGSNEGTFNEGRRIDSEEFDESLSLRLGHPVAGPELTLIPILSAEEEERRFARKRRNKRLLVGAAGLAIVLVLGGVIGISAVLGGGDGGRGGGGGGEDGSQQLTASERSDAIAGTVFLTYEVTTSQGSGIASGSGSIITNDGLILTNAHVAAPQAEGLTEIYGPEVAEIPDPEFLLVSMTGEGGSTDGADYRARLVKADGNVDAAVIQIFADEDGNEVDPSSLDLPTIAIDDSENVSTGDQLTILGFPAIARNASVDPEEFNPAVTVTTGVVSTFIDGPLGERSEIDTDARIAPGNSGGAAINNDGELIGIPSAISTGASGGESLVLSGRIRPVDYVADLIKDAEADAN